MGSVDPDPDPGPEKWPTKEEKKLGNFQEISYFEVLDVLFSGLGGGGGVKASPVVESL